MTSDDSKRTAVKTYVPQYQKDRWATHADELGMSQSEFVRTMVQAGRHDFEIPTHETAQALSGESASDGEKLETRVVEALDGDGHRPWDELLAAVTDDIEDRLEATLQTLQADNRVQYNGRHGGYSLIE